MVGIYEFVPRSEFIEFVGRSFCGDSAVLTTQPFCTVSLFLTLGRSPYIKVVSNVTSFTFRKSLKSFSFLEKVVE